MNEKRIAISCSLLFIFLTLQPIIQPITADECGIQKTDFDTAITSFMRFDNIPNLELGIIKDGELVWRNSYSLKRRFDPVSDENTIFQIGSLSKTITAIALLQLYDQELLNLDDDINDYLQFPIRHPDYPDTPITFRMLLSHTSGISNDLFRLFIYFSLLNYPNEMIKEFLTPGGSIYKIGTWSEWKPGTATFYSSVEYELIEYLIEIISGTSFPDYCHEHIFSPLKMENTSFKLDALDATQIIPSYLHLLGSYILIPPYENHNYAAGGMKTTLNDLTKIVIAIQNNGTYQDVNILYSETMNELRTIQYPNVPQPPGQSTADNREFGLGWLIYPEEKSLLGFGYEGHAGSVPGGIAGMYIKNDTGIIYLGNQWTFATKRDFWYRTALYSLLFDRADEL